MIAAKNILHRAGGLLLLTIGGCISDNNGIVIPPEQVPVVVRGSYNYSLTFAGTDATIDVRDSVVWSPAQALLSVTVSGYTGGNGILEITDSTGAYVYHDSLNGNIELLNQRILSPMPYRVHLALGNFSGNISCVLVLSPAELDGLLGRFVLRDTNGVVRTSFARTASIDFHYSLVNLSGRTQRWGKGDSRPHCQFTVWRADTLRADSFHGLAWLASPESGDLAAGDSIRVVWRRSPGSQPLTSGHYVARADPQTAFPALGFLTSKEYSFDILP